MSRERSFKKIVFALPSYCEADSIGRVAQAVDEGLREFFPKKASVIVNADNDSPDGTKEAFLKIKTKHRKIYINSGGRGKGRNVISSFRFAQKIGADAVGFIDSDVVSVEPEWVKKLIEPVFAGYDHVLPVYLRGKYDGSITNHLVRPVLYAIFGADIRQPIGGEAAFSRRAYESFLSAPRHASELRYGIDISLTIASLAGDLRVGQTFLGVKAHKLSQPKLVKMFLEVADALFGNLYRRKILPFEKDPLGRRVDVLAGRENNYRAPEIPFDHHSARAYALTEYKKYRPAIMKIWNTRMHDLDKIFGYEENGKCFLDAKIWTELLREFMVYGKKKPEREELEALRSLYFGRVIGFYREVKSKSYAGAEKAVVAQAKLLRARLANPGKGLLATISEFLKKAIASF